MLAFDSAARETCIVRETRTNTPVQALNLMNDVTYIEASRVFAERMIHQGGTSPAERLTYGFRLATARKPSAPELEILIGTLKRYEDRYQTRPADAGKFSPTASGRATIAFRSTTWLLTRRWAA